MRSRAVRVLSLLGLSVLVIGALGASGTEGAQSLVVQSYQDVIRFQAQGAQVEQLRLQVYSLAGEAVFDSGLQRSRVLDWRRTSRQGERLAYGIYLYRMELRDRSGNVLGWKTGKLVLGPGQAELGPAPPWTEPLSAPRAVEGREGAVTPQGDDTNGTACGHNSNTCPGILATVGGGSGNTAGGDLSTVGGGQSNTAGGDLSTVGGGQSNTASGSRSTVGGGINNLASGSRSTVGGGFGNTASGSHSTVGGGLCNRAGNLTQATCSATTNPGDQATVGGGLNNLASGNSSTVPGGDSNVAAGDYSFAAGRRAKANHDGAFVWADSTNADFASTAADQFLIRASGGVGINESSPAADLHISQRSATVSPQIRMEAAAANSQHFPNLRFFNGTTPVGQLISDVAIGRFVFDYCGDCNGDFTIRRKLDSGNAADFVMFGNFEGNIAFGGNTVQPGARVTVNGNLHVNGNISKTGAGELVLLPDEAHQKQYVYSTLIGPEIGTYVRGTAQLIEGEAVIELPEHFAQVTAAEGLTVQLTPIGEWLQLYIVEQSPERVVIREAQGKSGQFHYLVQGIRKGYEDHQVVQEEAQEPEQE